MAADVQAQRPALDRSFSTSVLERPPASDQDPSAMTIEFLRARLLSERSVSKAARQQAEQLVKKVSELEQQLEAEIRVRKRLESARLEVLSNYKGELNAEYGDGFDSNLVEGDSDRTTGDPKEDSHAGVASSSRNDDIERWERERAVDEGFSQAIALEDDEGSQFETFDREEDGNEGSVNDDDDVDHIPGKDKGVLAWGSRRVRRQQSMERYGRSFSPKSYESTDAESPNKRWMGKSVRQKKQKENRVQYMNYEEPAQIQDREDCKENSIQPEEKTGLRCNVERDTEVERVLERQAEFIERFEAEEKAQKEWEEKFREQTPSIGNGEDIHLQNKDKSSIINRTDENNPKDKAAVEEGAVNSAKANGNLSSEHEAVATVHFEKVHQFSGQTYLKDGVPPAPSQTLHRTTSEDVNFVGSGTKKPALSSINDASVKSAALQGDSSSPLARGAAVLMEKGLQERQRETSEDAMGDKRGEEGRFRAASQERIDSSDINIRAVERDRHDGVGKLDRHSKLSSSFRFKSFAASPNQNINMLTENDPSTSPQLQGFDTRRHTVKKTIQDPTKEAIRTSAAPFSDQARAGTASGDSSDEKHPRTVSREESSVGYRKSSAVREPREILQEGKGSFWSAGLTGKDSFYDTNLQASRTASNYHHSHRQQSVFPDKINDPREEVARQAEEVASILEETTQRGRTQSQWKVRNDSTQTLSSHGFSDNLVRNSPWEDAFRRRIVAHDTIKQEPAGRPSTLHGFSAYQDLRMENPSQNGSANHQTRAKLDNFPPLPGRRGAIRDDYLRHDLSHSSYQDADFTSHRKSVDGGFDRLRGVLKALQVAKQHVQSSEDQEIDLNSANRSGYDNRNAFHRELGSRSSNPQYTNDAAASAYLFSHVKENPSRASSNDHHVHHRPEQQPYWMPHGTHNSNLYRHDARQPSRC